MNQADISLYVQSQGFILQETNGRGIMKLHKNFATFVSIYPDGKVAIQQPGTLRTEHPSVTPESLTSLLSPTMK